VEALRKKEIQQQWSTVSFFFFWFVRFLFVLSKLQVVDRPASGSERKSKARLFQDLSRIDKKKRRGEERESKILVLGL
jgi:hypothetical protein